MKTLGSGPAGATIDGERYRVLGSVSRVTILREIRASADGLTAADIVDLTGLHLSTARDHLDRLVEAGLLEKSRASDGMPGRPAWRYRACARPDPAPAPYRALTEALLVHLVETAETSDVRTAAARAGEPWGRRLAARAVHVDPVDTVMAVLEGLGFDPVQLDPVQLAAPAGRSGSGPTPPGRRPTAAPPVEIHLRVCPFLELVGERPDAMCGLHTGMLQGVMHQAGATEATAVLEPFGAPQACVVRLLGPLWSRS